MSNIERFYLGATLLGLLVDAVTIISLASGGFNPNFFLGSALDSAVISILTIFALMYFVVLINFFVIEGAKKRWQEKGQYPSRKTIEGVVGFVSYTIWVPLFLVWSIYIWSLVGQAELNGFPYFLVNVGGGVVFLLGLLLAGAGLGEAALALDRFLNPESETLWNAGKEEE